MSQKQEKRFQDRLMVAKAAEMSHYSARRANQIKGRRVCVSQADETA